MVQLNPFAQPKSAEQARLEALKKKQEEERRRLERLRELDPVAYQREIQFRQNKQKEEERQAEPEKPPKKITPEEKARLLKENPGMAVDEFGNIRDPTTKEAIQDVQEKALSETGTTIEQEEAARKEAALQRQEGQLLSQQVGQFQQANVSPTGLDFQEATTTGLVNAIPRAISFAATGAAVGATGGAVFGGVGAAPGAIIGAVGGFLTGITSSMISNFKSQRTDTTTAQQRILDEGKQNLNDWATLAASDPANRAVYVANFNQQLAQIDQAYRQMKLDTQRDVLKFETALPNLAEFEAFYNTRGERDFLTARMYESLNTPQDTENIYRLAELYERRGLNNA